MELLSALLGALIGACLLAAGFIAGWYARNRLRTDAEPDISLRDEPLHDPIDLSMYGRYVTPDEKER